jgi:hypothetical protein
MRSNYQINRAFAVIAEWIDQADNSDIQYDPATGAATLVEMPAKVVAATMYIKECGIGRDEHRRRLKSAMLANLKSRFVAAPKGVH